MQQHWDDLYRRTPVEATGWYEEAPRVSLDLIARCGLTADDPILDVGSGASTLVDHLLDVNHRRIIAVDISAVALGLARDRLGAAAEGRVSWLVDDVTQPGALDGLRDVALWHDRAVLHFLLDEAGVATYVRTLRRVLREGGHATIAAFSLEGAARCSGLPVRRYDADMLCALLGEGFRLLEARDHAHITPSGGRRPYVYTLFQRA